MKITNTSIYPDSAVQTLVTWVAKQMEVEDYVDVVDVTNCNTTTRGRCWGKRALLRVGPPAKFPMAPVQYRKRALAYGLNDWKEALVSIAAHEFNHSRQFRRRAQELETWRRDCFKAVQRCVLEPPRPPKRPHSEVECENQAYAVLHAYRACMTELLATIEGAEVRAAARATAREERAAARATPPDPREVTNVALAKAQAGLARWQTKVKRAETGVKKWSAKVRRLERKAARMAAMAPAALGLGNA